MSDKGYDAQVAYHFSEPAVGTLGTRSSRLTFKASSTMLYQFVLTTPLIRHSRESGNP